MAAFAPDKAPCRIVVLISGSGSNLQALLDAAADTEHDFEVVAAISNKAGVQGLQRAQAAGVDAVVIDHRHFLGTMAGPRSNRRSWRRNRARALIATVRARPGNVLSTGERGAVRYSALIGDTGSIRWDNVRAWGWATVHRRAF